MATYAQNLANIRGAAVLGTELRASIAEAIQQAQGFEELTSFDARIAAAEQRIVQQETTVEATLLHDNDYAIVFR